MATQTTQNAPEMNPKTEASAKEEPRNPQVVALEAKLAEAQKAVEERDTRIKELEAKVAAANDSSDRVQTKSGSRKAIKEAYHKGAFSYLALSKKFDVDIEVVRQIIEGK